jgi:hypothetical protein
LVYFVQLDLGVYDSLTRKLSAVFVRFRAPLHQRHVSDGDLFIPSHYTTAKKEVLLGLGIY